MVRDWRLYFNTMLLAIKKKPLSLIKNLMSGLQLQVQLEVAVQIYKLHNAVATRQQVSEH